MTPAHEISVDFNVNVFVYLFIKMKTLLLHLRAEETCVITAKNKIISFKEETRMSNFYHDCIYRRSFARACGRSRKKYLDFSFSLLLEILQVKETNRELSHLCFLELKEHIERHCSYRLLNLYLTLLVHFEANPLLLLKGGMASGCSYWHGLEGGVSLLKREGRRKPPPRRKK